MIITDFAHLDKPITVQLKQKGVRMTRAGEAKEMSKGWRIYSVGYGFNAMTNEIARNPICMMDSMSQDGLLTKDAIKLEFQERHYTGSCYSELTNNLKAEAKFSGEYSGFKGEVSASFDMSTFKENKYEYAKKGFPRGKLFSVNLQCIEKRLSETKTILNDKKTKDLGGMGDNREKSSNFAS